jgi:RNA polymerase sigma-70 factor, ECF subfamily
MDERHLRMVRTEDTPAGVDLSDDDLMRLCRQNRHDAYEILVRRHQTLVFALATRFFSDRSVGRDVAQDVFLSIWAERGRYQPSGRFKSYLVSVTFHRCKYIARQRRSHERKLSGLNQEVEVQAAVSELPLQEVLEMERAREVRDKLTELPEKMRQVMILRFTHDLGLSEIASMTSQPLGTVKSHLFRGLKRLHRLLSTGGTS